MSPGLRAAGAKVAVLALAAFPAAAAEATTEIPWEVVVRRPIVVRTRPRPGTAVKEFWVSGVLAAPAADVQAAVLDGDSYPRFMPYVKEARHLPQPTTTDGSWYGYQLVSAPFVAPREGVYRVWLERSIEPDGSGMFRNRWVAVPGILPGKPGAVRLLLSEGSWEVVPLAEERCRADYRFTVDPGGQIPAWLADLGNRSGIPDVFRAVEGEAKRRAGERQRLRARAEAERPDAGPGARETPPASEAQASPASP